MGVHRARLVRGQAAMLAAAKQNKAFNFAQVLYDNQGTENTGWLTDSMVYQIAESVPGLNVPQLLTDRKSSAVKKQASDVAADAAANKVQGTPTVFVGKTGTKPKLVGARAPRPISSRPAWRSTPLSSARRLRPARGSTVRRPNGRRGRHRSSRRSPGRCNGLLARPALADRRSRRRARSARQHDEVARARTRSRRTTSPSCCWRSRSSSSSSRRGRTISTSGSRRSSTSSRRSRSRSRRWTASCRSSRSPARAPTAS